MPLPPPPQPTEVSRINTVAYRRRLNTDFLLDFENAQHCTAVSPAGINRDEGGRGGAGWGHVGGLFLARSCYSLKAV